MPKKRAKYIDVKVLQRRDRVREDYYVNRIRNRRALAARHGVSLYTIQKDLKRIREETLQWYQERGNEITQEAMQTLDGLITKAQAAFERSREDSEKIRTEYNREKCKFCKGTGKVNDGDDFEEDCGNCKGEGSVVVEVVTRETSGQAGDPRFLNLIKDCVKEQCKIAGVYQNDTNVQFNVVNPNIDLSGLSDDKVLDALTEIQHSMLPDSSDDDDEDKEDDAIDVDFE